MINNQPIKGGKINLFYDMPNNYFRYSLYLHILTEKYAISNRYCKPKREFQVCAFGQKSAFSTGCAIRVQGSPKKVSRANDERRTRLCGDAIGTCLDKRFF